MGAFLDKPKTDIDINEGTLPDGKYCHCSMQGWRTEMEDSYSVQIGLPGELSKWSYFGIFDGHAGKQASLKCSKLLLDYIIKTEEFIILSNSVAKHHDKELISKGIKKGFYTFDQALRKEIDDNSGSTATVAFVTPDQIILANCGDSRSIITFQGECVESTKDHKPHQEKEKERIINSGAQVLIGRINGSLAVSRSLGDFDYKKNKDKGPEEQTVSCEPQIFFYECTLNDVDDLVLACDGIWDVFDNSQVAAFIHQRSKCLETLPEILTELFNLCLVKGSKDNMSVMVVRFRPTVSRMDPDIKRLDVELEQKIKDLVHEFYDQDLENNFENILEKIQDLKLPNYPPGGGFCSKQHLIQTIFDEITKKRSSDVPPGASLK